MIFVGALRNGPVGSNSLAFGEYGPFGESRSLPRAAIPAVQRLSAESAGNSSPGRSCGVGSAVPPGFSTASPRARRPCRLPSPAQPRNGLRWVWPPGVPASKRGGGSSATYPCAELRGRRRERRGQPARSRAAGREPEAGGCCGAAALDPAGAAAASRGRGERREKRCRQPPECV